MNAKTTGQRQREFYAKQREAGFVKHSEWIHKDDVDDLKLCAAELRIKRRTT